MLQNVSGLIQAEFSLHIVHMHAITMNTKEKEKYIEEFDFPYCDESSKYEKVAKIGQGTFGYARILRLTLFCSRYFLHGKAKVSRFCNDSVASSNNSDTRM